MKSLSYLKVLKKKTKSKKRSKRRRALKRKIKRQNNLKNSVSFPFDAIMSGNSYWKNYNNVVSWQNNYHNFVGYCNFSPRPFNARNDNFSAKDKRVLYKNTDLSRSQNISPVEEVVYHDNNSDVESENEYVVTEEMMKFLEISMRHKQEREMNKAKELLNKETANEVNKLSDRDNIEECQAPKEKAVDALRMKEMNDLYGNSAAMIMGMETALQLTFNRNCDLYKPPYWPFLPLNLKFSN